MVDVDFDVLKAQGYLVKTSTYEDLMDALTSYKEIYESLSVAEQVLYGNEGEAISFKLHITSTPPYVITTQIDLI